MKSRSTMGQRLRQRGFDRTRYDRSTSSYRVRCSQCEATVINGIPTHEQGCPNAHLQVGRFTESRDPSTWPPPSDR